MLVVKQAQYIIVETMAILCYLQAEHMNCNVLLLALKTACCDKRLGGFV